MLFLAVLISVSVHAQVQAGAFVGVSNYTGDLLDKPYDYSHSAAGVTLGYVFTDRFTMRAGMTFGKIAGSDEASNLRDFSKRNLSFQSALHEFSIAGEYNLFDITNTQWTPFAFMGLAIYHYDPYTFDATGQKYYLKPLSTEGQGLAQYPDRKPYALTRLAIPVGGGLKYAISDRVQVAAQIGLRITNNDYLDDVSTTYVDENDLLAARGPKAVELSYRADELPGSSQAYPAKGAHRGRSGKLIYTDFYYFSGLHITFNLGKNDRATYGGNRNNKKGYGCPAMH